MGPGRTRLHDRFGNIGELAKVVAPERVFSVAEHKRIVDLGIHMGLDMGEVDAIRDRGDGRLHVVDVNNMPVSPLTAARPSLATLRAMHRVAGAFERE